MCFAMYMLYIYDRMWCVVDYCLICRDGMIYDSVIFSVQSTDTIMHHVCCTVVCVCVGMRYVLYTLGSLVLSMDMLQP